MYTRLHLLPSYVYICLQTVFTDKAGQRVRKLMPTQVAGDFFLGLGDCASGIRTLLPDERSSITI